MSYRDRSFSAALGVVTALIAFAVLIAAVAP
jgi:hypothetical protein